jgi:hypothetical protein
MKAGQFRLLNEHGLSLHTSYMIEVTYAARSIEYSG